MSLLPSVFFFFPGQFSSLLPPPHLHHPCPSLTLFLEGKLPFNGICNAEQNVRRRRSPTQLEEYQEKMTKEHPGSVCLISPKHSGRSYFWIWKSPLAICLCFTACLLLFLVDSAPLPSATSCFFFRCCYYCIF